MLPLSQFVNFNLIISINCFGNFLWQLLLINCEAVSVFLVVCVVSWDWWTTYRQSKTIFLLQKEQNLIILNWSKNEQLGGSWKKKKFFQEFLSFNADISLSCIRPDPLRTLNSQNKEKVQSYEIFGLGKKEFLRYEPPFLYAIINFIFFKITFCNTGSHATFSLIYRGNILFHSTPTISKHWAKAAIHRYREKEIDQ